MCLYVSGVYSFGHANVCQLAAHMWYMHTYISIVYVPSDTTPHECQSSCTAKPLCAAHRLAGVAFYLEHTYTEAHTYTEEASMGRGGILCRAFETIAHGQEIGCRWPSHRLYVSMRCATHHPRSLRAKRVSGDEFARVSCSKKIVHAATVQLLRWLTLTLLLTAPVMTVFSALQLECLEHAQGEAHSMGT